jgi:YbbR domain-containing protein
VPLTWATRGTRTLPVRADITGEALEGTRVKEVRVAPGHVQVTGPEVEIDGLSEIRTEPIDVHGLRIGVHQRQVPLLRSRRNLTFGTPAPIEVTIEIAAALDERTLDDLDIAVVGSSARSQLRPREVDVVLRGLPVAMQSLDADRVVPFVDVAQLEPTGIATPVRVDLRGVPEGVDVVRVEPPEVLITLTPRR